MKKHLLLLFLTFLCMQAFPQQKYGYEWIKYNQQYFRIFVMYDGIYRIDSTTLANAGIDLNTIDPRKFQIFGRGVEQYIYVKGESDGRFNSSDYIEFYGMHNDGWYDVNLYDKPEDQPSPGFSMFNDTAVYYLTISNSMANLRMADITDNNFTGTPATYFNSVSEINYPVYYYYGKTDVYKMTSAKYDKSEGWFSAGFSIGSAPLQLSVPVKNAIPGSSANYDFRMTGASDYANLKQDHHVNIITSPSLLTLDIKDTGYYSKNFSGSFSLPQTPPSAITFNFSVQNDLGSGADGNTVAYIRIKYRHNTDLEGLSNFTMYVPDATGQTKTLLNMSNFNVASGDVARLYDLTNHKRINVSKAGSIYRVMIPNSGGEKKCHLTSDAQAFKVPSVIPVSYNPSYYARFRDLAGVNTPSVLNSDYIIISHPDLWNSAVQYSTYRGGANGGNFDTLLVDINDLYDQFCYGIRKNPLAIRNFAHFAYDNFNSPPKYLFLIGKGYSSNLFRKDVSLFSESFIPGFGVPPSDVLFTVFDTGRVKQYIPTGRLAARTPDHVRLYLDKITEYEAVQRIANSNISGTDEWEWMKKVLHFGGGSDISQQNVLESYLDGYAKIITDTFFGGHVTKFLKSSTDPIQLPQSDLIKTLVNNGVSLLTIFGHGSGAGFDISINNPQEFLNKERYPFLLANSCLTGDLFNYIPTSSEEFVLIADKGTIGYLASGGRGVDTYLDKYSKEIYKNIGVYNYGESIGNCIKNTVDTVIGSMNGGIWDYLSEFTCLEMTLHGDPALKINYFSEPDYSVTQPDIYFTPSIVTTQLDSFTVNIVCSNNGRAIDSSFYVNINREFPDGSNEYYDTLITAPLYKDTISIKFPVDITKGTGLNKFSVYLDCYLKIYELSEANNKATTSLLITSDEIIPVYPYEYAIVPSINVTLKASTGNPFAAAKDYIFEIDTTDSFNSPVKLSQTINHPGGVVTWTPDLPVKTDSTVYFWRTASTDTSNGGYRWHESSFQYITGKRGWGQAHFFQFKNDGYRYVTYNKPARKFEFINSVNSIVAQTGYFTYSNYNHEKEYVDYNNEVISANCIVRNNNNNSNPGAIKIIVFDDVSCEPWKINRYDDFTDPEYGYYHCQSYPTKMFEFYFGTDEDREKVARFITDSIPQNNYVLIMTHRSAHYSDWDNDIIEAFKSIGSTIQQKLMDGSLIDNDGKNLPYIIRGKKGAAFGTVPELYFAKEHNGDLDQLRDTIISKWSDGDIKSTIIGPAAKWDSLHWRVKSADPHLTDIVKLNVYGIQQNGTVDTLIENLQPVPGSLDISISDISSSLYPYLKLIAVMKDDSFSTPSQMVRWQVIYEPEPETALDPAIYYSFHKDTISEGDSIRFATAIHNISEYNMDSLLVNYWILDKNRTVVPVKNIRYRPHPAGDIIIDTVVFSTDNLAGLNSFWIEVNPKNDQPEQFHFNNIGEVYFYVGVDKINPLLDVTFDGVHILDNDIVSAKPVIEIRLKDENKFLLMNQEADTSFFSIFIQNPGASEVKRIFFRKKSTGEEIMKFYPASSAADNKCRIEYPAYFPADGIYRLIVQATDKSKNQSGNYDYEINFEVINRSTITEVMNWPNPFSTSTKFVFTLTGSEIPTYFKIQIMTVTGKVVREIGMEDLGSVHIGRNITEYAWDGKDDFGDQLANGVYLYRVITKINGLNIEKRETGADKYFNHQFGKMYLMK